MGTTIRREPVNFDIPNAPKYKFLNITNFRGLDVSSNPFELATNTASDCLNVYVDETNTLTTRPRLEKKIATPINGKHISTHKLKNGYLLKYEQQKEGDYRAYDYFYKLIDGQLTEITIQNAPSKDFDCFEHEDDIYLVSKSGYYKIRDNFMDFVSNTEAYIPTAYVVSDDGSRHAVEPINLLSGKYLEKYVWTFSTKISYDTEDILTIDAFKQDNYKGPFGDNKRYSIEYDNSDTNMYLVEIDQYNTKTKVLNLSDKLQVAGHYYSVTRMTFRKENHSIWIESPSENNIVCVMYNVAGEWKHALITATSQGYTFDQYVDRRVSANGREYIMPDMKTGTTITIYTLVESTGTFTTNKITLSGITIYDPIFYGNVLGTNNGANGIVLMPDRTNALVRLDESSFSYDVHIIKDGQIMQTNANGFVCINDIATGEIINKQLKNFKSRILAPTQNYDGSLWYCDDENKIYIIPDTSNINSNHIYSGMTLIGDYISMGSSYVTDDVCYFFTGTSPNPEKHNITFIRKYDKSETTVTVQKSVLKNDSLYQDWLNRRKGLCKSTVFTRFDNNYWLVGNNKYFRSRNNDPTYFPITEYNELGNDDEEITGFNIANDTTLIAYKNDKIYLIQPFTSSLDTTEYTITESKNTVGNTAIGAPIVTTLTEIPLQINNDGIYGLTQVSNVSATERIADLMSEPINERWLNIDKNLISNIKTLNRLYWTYIIIPDIIHEKTMIYLLDNRSNSWYYWELPIVVSNSFVKDTRAEFVDVDGNIYYLTSTDVINKAFDTQLITEYYDDGRKLIPWYWQSQIMPLGTMNYSKRLVNTTFILTDTDDKDGYGLNYSFKVFRKLASSTPEKELTGDLTLVRSTTKKTNISKFGFVQLKLSNITEKSQGTEPEKAFRNNKLRLVGLGLKYVLLEGLIR